MGEYGLRNKRELWIVKMFLAKIRKAARELLTLDEKDARRLFQGKLWFEFVNYTFYICINIFLYV